MIWPYKSQGLWISVSFYCSRDKLYSLSTSQFWHKDLVRKCMWIYFIKCKVLNKCWLDIFNLVSPCRTVDRSYPCNGKEQRSSKRILLITHFA